MSLLNYTYKRSDLKLGQALKQVGEGEASEVPGEDVLGCARRLRK